MPNVFHTAGDDLIRVCRPLDTCLCQRPARFIHAPGDNAKPISTEETLGYTFRLVNKQLVHTDAQGSRYKSETHAQINSNAISRCLCLQLETKRALRTRLRGDPSEDMSSVVRFIVFAFIVLGTLKVSKRACMKQTKHTGHRRVPRSLLTSRSSRQVVWKPSLWPPVYPLSHRPSLRL